MKLTRMLCFLILISTITSCKVDKKETKEIKGKVEKNKSSSFESKLIDVKDINKNIVEGYGIEKFGIQKVNDSVHAFVFKLKEGVTENTVNSYSIGIRGFDSEFPKKFGASFNPELTVIDNNKFLILKRKMQNIVYFDSIEVYAYERQNWKKSGKLGALMIKDIVFE